MVSFAFILYFKPRTFNPADYSDSSSIDGCGTKPAVWEAAQNGADEGNGKCLFLSDVFLKFELACI